MKRLPRRCQRLGLIFALSAFASLLAAETRLASSPTPSVRLYVFDNGIIAGLDPTLFGFKREELATTDLAVVSYLIVHPKGTLQWDSGAIADGLFPADGGPATMKTRHGVYTATKAQRTQMAAIGYSPEDITYFALSHHHSDHTANANDFAGSIWLVQQPEREAMFPATKPKPTAHYAALRNSPVQILTGEDYDVFGDGTVVIKAAYGHTPGHQVLSVRLAKTGPVVLAGDLYHYQEERGATNFPTFESDKVQSLASRTAIEAFIRKTGAQLWLAHDLLHFRRLTKVPGYYE